MLGERGRLALAPERVDDAGPLGHRLDPRIGTAGVEPGAERGDGSERMAGDADPIGIDEPAQAAICGR